MPETPTAMVNTINPSLYVAFELGWKTWKLASTVDLGTKPRISTVRAGDLKAVVEEFKRWLEEQRLWDGSRLPSGVAVRILMEHDRLSFVRSQILAVEKERRRMLAEQKTKAAQVAHKLHRLGAIGVNSAWTFSSELFATRHFDNRKQVGSLIGLTPTPFDSGESGREQGIDKAGNKWARSMAVEIAWGWLRFQPRSELSIWYQRRFGGGSNRIRKIGIVALARKLMIALWHWTEHDVLPKGATLKA